MKQDMKKPIFGFLLSLALTLGAYITTVRFINSDFDNLTANTTLLMISGFAFLQLYVQMIFFLHLGTSRKNRWNLVSFLYTSVAVLLIVIGTIWIMKNLEYGHSGHDSTIQQNINNGIAEDEIPTKNSDHQGHSQDAQ